MVSVGRIFCVAFPFVATFAAFLTLLVATLGGSRVDGVYLFEIDLTNLSIDPQGLDGLIGNLKNNVSDTVNGITDSINDSINDSVAGQTSDVQSEVQEAPKKVTVHRPPPAAKKATVHSPASSPAHRRDGLSNLLGVNRNVSASDLGLDNIYQVNLWGACSGPYKNKTTCTAPKWDWATSRLNETFLENIGAAMGANVKLPSEVHDGLKAFATSIKYLQIIFAVALGLLLLEIVFGAFSSCSRLWSCLAYVVAGIATTVSIAAAAFATVVAAAIVGALKGSSKLYGFDASFNKPFLALVWLSVAFSIVAGLFWCLSVCCCAPEHRRSRRGGAGHGGGVAGEKDYNAGSYQPLTGEHHNAEAGAGSGAGHQSQAPYQTGAYEPYSHRV